MLIGEHIARTTFPPYSLANFAIVTLLICCAFFYPAARRCSAAPQDIVAGPSQLHCRASSVHGLAYVTAMRYHRNESEFCVSGRASLRYQHCMSLDVAHAANLCEQTVTAAEISQPSQL